ncbi:hypothetical protein BCT04_03085 [Vibrio breoganii]|nr:hypothetical protein BCT04_03085 [Vibrio breoganii]
MKFRMTTFSAFAIEFNSREQQTQNPRHTGKYEVFIQYLSKHKTQLCHPDESQDLRYNHSG